MITIPADVAQQLSNVDWSGVQAAVKDYGPALKVLSNTWDKESLKEISEGKLFVSDDIMNEAIAKQITDGAPVSGIKLTSHKNGRMDIAIDGTKVGRVELSGTIDSFVHDGDSSYMVYHVRNKNIPSHGLMSWVFSRVSLGMAQRMVGSFSVSDGLPMKISGNKVRIDYSQALAASDFGKTTFQGHRLLDMIEIVGAKPKEGGVEFQTKLHVPDDVRASLKTLVKADD